MLRPCRWRDKRADGFVGRDSRQVAAKPGSNADRRATRGHPIVVAGTCAMVSWRQFPPRRARPPLPDSDSKGAATVKRFAMLVLALGVPVAAAAAPTQLKIDTSHSEVGFNIRHFFTKVHGRFTDFSGA